MAGYASLTQGTPEGEPDPSGRRASLLDERTQIADPELLRGAPFPVVVAGLGQLLEPTGTIASSTGALSTEDTFVFSKRVDLIHHFLSHSWRDSGKLKWLSLIVYANFFSAMMMGHLLAAIVFAIVFFCPDVYPFPGVDTTGNMAIDRYRYGPFAMVCMVVFLGSIFLVHLITRKSPDLFLDKLCIHQTDPDRKVAGIRGLGAFLKRSENMLVLWGDDYFDRLWCGYELALYIRLHGTSAVQIMPIDYAAYLFALGLTMFYSGFVVMLFDSGAPLSPIVAVPSLMPYVLIGVYKAKVYEARQQLRTTLLDYDVRKTSCFCCHVNHVSPDGRGIPCDRIFVEESIAAWYGYGTHNGLDAFNETVRTKVSEDTATILGKDTVAPLPFLILISSLTVWQGLGQGSINPWNSHRFKVGTILELCCYPFYFFLADALTGVIIRMLWKCNLEGSCFRCLAGLVFVFLIFPTICFDIVFLNVNIPLWMCVIVALSIFVCGVAARHFAPHETLRQETSVFV
eukprot:TRINITY_DN11291_c0_g4_i2.p1 TRINITY_DN11291_c0_g4~~TRINITY_DN11291_c0_g4_i2.p1  ORF type:complete len:527 (+),score=47.93 TRINITY_DN11291_c0_g4_i2:44-1582(+)